MLDYILCSIGIIVKLEMVQVDIGEVPGECGVRRTASRGHDPAAPESATTRRRYVTCTFYRSTTTRRGRAARFISPPTLINPPIPRFLYS